MVEADPIDNNVEMEQEEVHNEFMNQPVIATINDFRVLKKLGEGGFGTAYSALNADNEARSLKILKLANTRNKESLRVEYETGRLFDHKHILKFYDMQEDQEEVKADTNATRLVTFIEMELCTGGELFDVIANTGKMEHKFARALFRQILMGLHYMHKQGKAHRDIKLENVLLTSDNTIKIIDFGFVVDITGDQGTGFSKKQLGTPGYMAPELILKDKY